MNKNFFENRRTCRNFSSVKIEPGKIRDIVKKAMKAPTCGNMQLYTVVVTSDPVKLKEMASYHFNQPAASTAPLILTICADFNRFTRWCSLKNAKAGFNNFHSFITAMTDAVILAQQIVTIAELEGFGTCYLGTVNYNAKEISEMLQLPDLVVPVAALAIGVPVKEGEKTERLCPDSVIHFEHYREDNDKKILKYFKIIEDNPENNAFIEENNKENIAQVFAEVRYPQEMNEKVSETFMQLLQDKGFINK